MAKHDSLMEILRNPSVFASVSHPCLTPSRFVVSAMKAAINNSRRVKVMEAPFGLLRVGRHSGFPAKWAVLAVVLLSAACTPTVYKPDVERLSTNIDSATKSFKTLVANNATKDISDRNEVFVSRKARLALDRNCAKIDGFIKEQNECLKRWSLFRQNPSTVPKPSCAEPVPFAPIPSELQQCGIGAMQDGSFVSVPVATAKDAQNHLRLAEALAAYAAQLDAIVSAADGDQREAAGAGAGAAAQSLQDKLVAADSKAKPVDIGPIASFIGTGLRLALEAKRLAILKNVAGRADPVVQQASGQLAIFANQLYYINELQPAFATFDNAVQRAVPEPSGTFPARVEEATAREQVYAAALAVTPGDVFKAVADAHRDLVAALNDPSRQIDALKKSIATLSAKAKALADVLKMSEAKDKSK